MNSPFLVLNNDCRAAVRWISDTLNQSGLQVIQTFDLHISRMSHRICTCPHHGSEQCDCEMIVLLVYGQGVIPATVVAHGHNGQTWFMLVDSAQQSVPSGLGAAIQAALAAHVYTLKLEDGTNAT